MKTIGIVIPYFGKLPPFFNYGCKPQKAIHQLIFTYSPMMILYFQMRIFMSIV